MLLRSNISPSKDTKSPTKSKNTDPGDAEVIDIND